jgi:hypothetical protein
MSEFQKRYLYTFVILVVGSTVVAAVFWSNDFTITRIILNTLQDIVYAFIWAKLGIKIEGWVFRIKRKPPQVKLDEKPTWPPVVYRKD